MDYLKKQPKYLLLEVEDPRDSDPERGVFDLVLAVISKMERSKINKNEIEAYLDECVEADPLKIREITERWVSLVSVGGS